MLKARLRNLSLKNQTIIVAISNIFLMLSGVLSTFIVAKVLGPSGYDQYKTFLLYATYTTFSQFGFINGIYIIFGGKNLEDFNRQKFRFLFRFFFVGEIFVSLLIFVVGALFFKSNIILFLFISIYCLTINLMNYFQSISQITMRFNEFSGRTFFQSILKIIISFGLLAFYLLAKTYVDYIVYICLYLLIFVILCVWYLFTYRDIVFGKCEKFSENKSLIFEIFKKGIPLLIADAIVILIYQSDKQIVKIGFSGEATPVFGYFSFAYTILSFVSTAVTSFSTVFYPIMKRTDITKLGNSVKTLQKNMSSLCLLAISSYFLAVLFIVKVLPEYSESLAIIRIVFLGVALTTTINVVFQNVYKTLNKNIEYGVIGLVILAVSIGLNITVYFLFKSIESIAAASIACYLVWYITLCIRIRKHLGVNLIKESIFLFVGLAIFGLCAFLFSDCIIGFFTYILSILLFLFFTFKPNLISFVPRKITNSDFAKRIILRFKTNIFPLTIKKKPLVLLLTCTIMVFACAISSSYLIIDNRSESTASIIENELNRNDVSFVYGQISSSEYKNNYSDFLYTARAILDPTIFKSQMVFIESHEGYGDHKPIKITNEEYSVESDVLGCPTTGYFSINSSFILTNGNQLSDISIAHGDNSKVFVTESMAKKLLSPEMSLNDLIGNKAISFAGYKTESETTEPKFIIEGIIKDDSLGDYSLLYPEGFVLMSLEATRNNVGRNKTISFIFKKGIITLTSFFRILYPSLASYDNMQFSFCGSGNSTSITPSMINQQYLNMLDFYSNHKTIRAVSFILVFLFVAVFCILCFVKNEHSLTKTQFLFVFIFSFTWLVLASSGLGFVPLGFPIYLKPYLGMTINSFIFVLVLIFSFISKETTHKEPIAKDYLEIVI